MTADHTPIRHVILRDILRNIPGLHDNVVVVVEVGVVVVGVALQYVKVAMSRSIPRPTMHCPIELSMYAPMYADIHSTIVE